jgi:hypothetical protein
MQLRQQRRQTAFAGWRLAIILVAIVTSVLATSLPAVGQSGAVAAQLANSGFYVNVASGKCLDASNWGQGENVIQYPCHRGPNQRWDAHFFDEDSSIGLQTPASWQCLDASNWGQGENVIQYDCHWGPNQRWRLRQFGANEWALINVASDKCLDASDWGNGENVIQYPCHWGPNQRWRVVVG